jgi:hypothetical protein
MCIKYRVAHKKKPPPPPAAARSNGKNKKRSCRDIETAGINISEKKEHALSLGFLNFILFHLSLDIFINQI